MTSVRDYLMRMEGMEANVEKCPTEKQWATMKDWLSSLKKALEDQAEALAAGHMRGVNHLNHTIDGAILENVKPASANGGATDIMARVADLKREGQAKAAAGAGPVALDAGPPAAMRKK